MRARWRWLTCGVLMLAGRLAGAEPPAAPTRGNDYALAQNWLCRPGRADACSSPGTATVIDAQGGRRVLAPAVASGPSIDCFYVYPTVSPEPTPNSDMRSTGAEEATVASQFAPFASVCRTFAPRYRQVSIAGLHAALHSVARPDAALHSVARPDTTLHEGPRPDTALAYEDVLDAWHSYLDNDNQGRGFVLIGHSQGAKILADLIADEIDGQALAARFVSAIIPGALIEVPAEGDSRAGGTYVHIPLCRAAAATGCVIAYSSFLGGPATVDDARFGVTQTPGRTAACVSPPALRGQAYAEPEFPSRMASDGSLQTDFVELPALIRAECTRRGSQHFLAITLPEDPRTARVERGLQALQARRPSWGLHVLDMNLVLGDLVAIVQAQARAWTSAPAAPAMPTPAAPPAEPAKAIGAHEGQ